MEKVVDELNKGLGFLVGKMCRITPTEPLCCSSVCLWAQHGAQQELHSYPYSCLWWAWHKLPLLRYHTSFPATLLKESYFDWFGMLQMSTIAQVTYAVNTWEIRLYLSLWQVSSLWCHWCWNANQTKQHFLTQVTAMLYLSIYCARLKNIWMSAF